MDSSLQTTERTRMEGVASTECPICGEDYGSQLYVEDATHHAAHCCLWKRFDHAKRVRIACRVESGINWAQAIEGESHGS